MKISAKDKKRQSGHCAKCGATNSNTRLVCRRCNVSLKKPDGVGWQNFLRMSDVRGHAVRPMALVLLLLLSGCGKPTIGELIGVVDCDFKITVPERGDVVGKVRFSNCVEVRP